MNNYILYTYDATGQKLKKTVSKGKSTTTTDYMNGFQYINDELAFLTTAEGYVKHTKAGSESLFNYVYHYTDHLGNIRLAYTKDPVSGEPKIIEENNYYPFGLKHPYNAAIYEFTANGSGVSLQQVNEKAYDYKYQGQELQDELGLNWYSFKYRNYMPDIGRFFNVDPLAEKYSYNGVYNFSENRVIDGRELEGLEYVSANKAKIEILGYGSVMYKMENHNGFVRAYYNGILADTKRWTSGEIGVNRDVSAINFGLMTRGHVGGRQEITNVKAIPIAKSTGEIDRRYKPLPIGSFPKVQNTAKGLLFVAALDLGLSITESALAYRDQNDIKDQLILLNKATGNLTDYINDVGIDDKYMNGEDLSSILNVIFQGKANKDNLNHTILGLKIYNYYNNDKNSQRILYFWSFIKNQSDEFEKLFKDENDAESK